MTTTNTPAPLDPISALNNAIEQDSQLEDSLAAVVQQNNTLLEQLAQANQNDTAIQTAVQNLIDRNNRLATIIQTVQQADVQVTPPTPSPTPPPPTTTGNAEGTELPDQGGS